VKVINDEVGIVVLKRVVAYFGAVSEDIPMGECCVGRLPPGDFPNVRQSAEFCTSVFCRTDPEC
jgi:hypothetical protein